MDWDSVIIHQDQGKVHMDQTNPQLNGQSLQPPIFHTCSLNASTILTRATKYGTGIYRDDLQGLTPSPPKGTGQPHKNHGMHNHKIWLTGTDHEYAYPPLSTTLQAQSGRAPTAHNFLNMHYQYSNCKIKFYDICHMLIDHSEAYSFLSHPRGWKLGEGFVRNMPFIEGLSDLENLALCNLFTFLLITHRSNSWCMISEV